MKTLPGRPKVLPLWIALLLGPVLLASAGAQQPPQGPPGSRKQAPKPVPKKVWTDEDVRALRTPADLYAEQQARAEQAGSSLQSAPEKTEPAKKQRLATRDEFIPPRTGEEAETRLAAQREEIRGQMKLLESVREDYFNEASDLVRQDLKKRIDQLTTDLKEAETHLKLLEESLAELKSASRPQSPQPPPASSDTRRRPVQPLP